MNFYINIKIKDDGKWFYEVCQEGKKGELVQGSSSSMAQAIKAIKPTLLRTVKELP